MRLERKLLLSAAFGLLSGVTQAQTPSPAQMGITTVTPNAVQVLDSSKNWATIGTVDPTTHLFSPAGLPPLVASFNTRTGAVTLNSGDVTGALGFTPYDAANPANYVNAAGAGVAAPVQSVATRTGAVTLTHSDITDWTTTLTPYALLASPAFSGAPTAPTPSPGDSTTKLATTAFVGAAVTAGAYTLPTASTTVLGGVKVDGSTINISGGVISGSPSGITAGTTPTSGYTAGKMVVSDGAKVTPSSVTDLGYTFSIPMMTIGSEYNYVTTNGANLGPAGFDFSIQTGAMDIRASLGTDPSVFRVYNFFTDASNSEWAAFDWKTTLNTLTLGAQKNGTGTLRPVNIVGSSVAVNGATLGALATVTPGAGVATVLGAAPNTNGGIGTATTTSVVVGAINTGGGSGVAPVGLAAVAAGSYLKSNGVTTIPAWQAFGANVQTALGVAAGATGSVALQSGAITTGNLVKWSGATGVSDATAVPSTNGFISTGTKPTNTTGTCPGSSGAGGATAGTFALVNICAAAGTVILTALPTATTGWACDMEDRVTRTATIVQSAATTTSATFIMGSTPSVANDVFQFKCTGY